MFPRKILLQNPIENLKGCQQKSTRCKTGEELLGFSTEFRKPEYVIVIFRTFLHANLFQRVEAF